MKSEVFNMDCLEGMKDYPNKYFDLAVVDPPYGIGKFWDGGDSKNKGYRKNEADWNQNIPTEEYFNELKRISRNQIIWGWNYYTDFLPPSNNLVVWDKHQSYKTNYSEFEIAWFSKKITARIFKVPLIHKIHDKLDYHPFAKPIKLYSLIYEHFLLDGGKVIDTHLGSGSNRIAADKAGNIDFTGFELDKDYYEAQEKRWKNYKQQLRIDFDKRV